MAGAQDKYISMGTYVDGGIVLASCLLLYVTFRFCNRGKLVLTDSSSYSCISHR